MNTETTYTITYFANDNDMGETHPDDCDKYRAWAKEALQDKFPNHTIEVSADLSTRTSWTDDSDNEDEISDFCHRLWDLCPWDWDLAD